MRQPVSGPSVNAPRLRSPCHRARKGPRLVAALAVSIGALSLAPDARADDDLGNDDNEASYKPPPTERRGGFSFGVIPSLNLAHYSGSLNEIAKLDDPAFHESTTSLGGGFATWFGGTLRDWFSFGLGYTMSGTFGEPKGRSGAFVLRLEGFPAYALGGAYRDLGVGLDVGIATGALDRDGTTVAEGGDMAHVGVSVFYEPVRLWKLSMGPSVSYVHDFSPSLEIDTFSLGWRVVFYGSPAAK